MKITHLVLLLVLIGLLACGQTPTVAPPIIVMTALAPPMPAAINTPSPNPTAIVDSTVFGAMQADEIQSQVIEAVPNDVFKKTMDGLVTAGSISGYQVVAIKVLPGDENLIAEVTYNVKTDDANWLADGGTQSADGWINDNCSLFDLLITETEFQLANRRACD